MLHASSAPSASARSVIAPSLTPVLLARLRRARDDDGVGMRRRRRTTARVGGSTPMCPQPEVEAARLRRRSDAPSLRAAWVVASSLNINMLIIAAGTAVPQGANEPAAVWPQRGGTWAMAEVSVVTGASSGIGRALCLAIVHAKGRAGAQPSQRRVVLAVARRQEELQLLAQEVAEAGDDNSGRSVVVPVAADITTQEGCDAVCDAVQRALRTEAELGEQSYASHVAHCAGILENVGQSCLEIAPLDLR